MAVVSGNPNLAQYRTRLGGVLQSIENCTAYLAPRVGSGFSPFWVISRPRVTISPENWQAKMWFIELDFFLAREKEGHIQIEELATNIDDDTVTVLNYFLDNQNLVTASLTTNQPGFIPGSLRITANSDAAFQTGNGVWLGSSYTLSFSHRVVYNRDFS